MTAGRPFGKYLAEIALSGVDQVEPSQVETTRAAEASCHPAVTVPSSEASVAPLYEAIPDPSVACGGVTCSQRSEPPASPHMTAVVSPFAPWTLTRNRSWLSCTSWGMKRVSAGACTKIFELLHPAWSSTAPATSPVAPLTAPQTTTARDASESTTTRGIVSPSGPVVVYPVARKWAIPANRPDASMPLASSRPPAA